MTYKTQKTRKSHCVIHRYDTVTFSPSYLMKNRYGIFYFQYRIPSKFLKIAHGRKLFRVSLRTRVRREALKQARKWAILMDKLANQFFDSPESFGKGMELLMKYQKEAGPSSDWETVEEFLMNLDEWEDAALSKAIEYSNARSDGLEDLRQENERLRKTIDLLHLKSGEPNFPATSPSSPSPSAESSTPNLSTLGALVDRYLSELSRNWSFKHRSTNEKDLSPKLKLFAEIVGDRPANEIKKEDIARYKTVLLNYPSNKSKKPAYRDLSIEQIAGLELPDEDKLSITTIGNHFTKVSSFLGWCEDNITGMEKDLKKPLQKLPNKTKSADEERDAFSADDLKLLFESKEYIQGQHRQASHYWVPLLGLFTGARANELCQLYKADVYQDAESKRWVISINDNGPDKKLKKPSHKRIVPLHKQLINLGFPDFVASVTTSRLFNELPEGRDGYAQAFSKWFNRTYRGKKHCNVGQANGENKNFHSFRHTVITQLHNQHHIDQATIARLVGQQPNDQSVTTSRYLKKRSIEDNSMIINKLSFPIDFTKIRRWRA
jgi:integrase